MREKHQENSMTNNKEIVLKLYAAFDRGQLDLGRSIMSEDCTIDLVGIPGQLDREAFLQFGLEFCKAFPDTCHQFDEVIEEDNKVVTIGKFCGTHLGNFQGLPATGKSIEVEVMHVDRLVDGRIVSHWGQGNQAGMMKQLGIAFIPGLSLITSAIRYQWQS